jgi:intracellular multiplication protein IcmK
MKKAALHWAPLAAALISIGLCSNAAAQAVGQGGNVSELGSTKAPPPPPPPSQPGVMATGPIGAAGVVPGMTAGQVNSPAAATLPSPKINLVNQAVRSTAPMTPQEILQFRKQIQQRQEAAYENIRPGPPPKPVITQYRLDLSPGATPPVVRAQIGEGALVDFIDAAGNPWPIVTAENFAAPSISVSKLDDHTMSIAINNPQAMGNVGVILKGLASPVMLTVVPAQAETDYRVDMIVPKVYGQSHQPLGRLAQASTPALQTQLLAQFLLQVVPKGAKELSVHGDPGVRAWQISPTRMVLRTPSELAIPGFYAMSKSPDGTYAYLTQLAPSIQLLSDGSYETVSIGGYDVGGAVSRLSQSAN